MAAHNLFSFTGKPATARRRPAHLAQAVLFSLLTATVVTSHAQSRLNEEFDENFKPWQETAIQLPAAPKPENLVEFEVSGTTTLRFAVDVNSISVGDDSVVRYTLVSRSPSGAQSVSYEGIRCESYQKKLYAIGQKDGSWTRSRRDQWEVITGTGANRQHAALARDYICRHKIVEGNARQIADRLRYKQPLVLEPGRQ